MRRAAGAIVAGCLALGLMAAPAGASPQPHPAHTDHAACSRLVESYKAADIDVGTMRAGDALNWFLYDSRTKSVRAIMGKRGDDSNIDPNWGTKMGAWCKAHFPKDATIQSAVFPA